MLTTANILTIARLVILPVMVWLFFVQASWAVWINLGLYILAALTDFLDGWIARKYNQISAFGTFLDPIADKIFVAAIMIMLIVSGPLSGYWAIIVIIILTREFLVAGLREYLGPYDVQMPVTKLAKWKTATQMLALGFLIAGPLLPPLLLSGQLLLSLAAVLTIITGWQYLKVGLDHIRKIT